jgi:hypothetical protein
MFQAHSILWHYLWVAPNLLLGVLAGILWKRGLQKRFRSFFLYVWFQAMQWLVLYPMDLLPSVSGKAFWRVCWGGAVLESFLVFLLISDIFASVFGQYEALARFGKLLICWGGALLIVTATGVAAYAPIQNRFLPIQGTHVLEEAMYIVVSGLMLLLFTSAAYFRLVWQHKLYGVALGLGFSSCIHLATWAISANTALSNSARNALDLVDMASFHVAVLIWFYYLLIPEKVRAKQPAVSLPENYLAVWNRELERLLHP